MWRRASLEKVGADVNHSNQHHVSKCFVTSYNKLKILFLISNNSQTPSYLNYLLSYFLDRLIAKNRVALTRVLLHRTAGPRLKSNSPSLLYSKGCTLRCSVNKGYQSFSYRSKTKTAHSIAATTPFYPSTRLFATLLAQRAL